MNAKMQREIGARVWANKIYGTQTLICDLVKGNSFRFPLSQKIYSYVGKGWYRDDKRAYRTGVYTACFKLEKTSG